MWILIAASVLSVALPEVELRTADGASATGKLTELDARHLAIQTASGPVGWDLGKLAAVTVRGPADSGFASRNVPSPISIELVDGSKLVAEALTAENERSHITLAGGQVIDVANEDIRSIRFVQPSEAQAAQWSKIVAGPTASDILVVKREDGIDYHRGIIRGITAEAVEFELEGERLPVRRSKVFGLVYHHSSGRELPEPVGTVVDRFGCTWTFRTVALVGDQVEWTTVLGLKVRRPAAVLASLDFSQGKAVYLSDLKPDSVQWTPYFGLGKELPSRVALYAPRQDRNAESGPLQIDGRRYAKGLSMHTRTTMVYRLPERFRRLAAVVGIDDSARPQGNVRLVIRGDDRVLFEMMVSGTDAPRPIELDMTGVRRLTILADFGQDFDVGDHLDLCDARLLK